MTKKMEAVVYACQCVTLVNLLIIVGITLATISQVRLPGNFTVFLLVLGAVNVAFWCLGYAAVMTPRKTDRERRPWLYHK